MGAKSFKFLRKRPRAHAGKTRALPAEESLKNDWGAKERKEKKKKNARKRVLSGSRIVEKFRVEGDLARNYP